MSAVIVVVGAAARRPAVVGVIVAAVVNVGGAPQRRLLIRLGCDALVVHQVFSNSSARCSTRTALPRRRRQPAMFIRQPASVATTALTLACSMKAALS